MSKRLQSSRDTPKKREKSSTQICVCSKGWGPTNMAGNKKSLDFLIRRYINSNGCVSIVSHVSFTGVYTLWCWCWLPWGVPSLKTPMGPPKDRLLISSNRKKSCRELEIYVQIWPSGNLTMRIEIFLDIVFVVLNLEDLFICLFTLQ